MVILPIRTDVHKVYGPPQGRWTLADWEKLPADDNRYEIIDGVLYMSTAPSYFHQWISMRLSILVAGPTHERGLAFCVASPVSVIMPGCDPVQPDFVVVHAEQKGIIQQKRVVGVPDVIVEILSPGNRDFDEEIKLNAYAKAGVPEYAIIDPAAHSFKLYRLRLKYIGQYVAPKVFPGEQNISFQLLSGISFRVNQLFDGAPDTTLSIGDGFL